MDIKTKLILPKLISLSKYLNYSLFCMHNQSPSEFFNDDKQNTLIELKKPQQGNIFPVQTQSRDHISTPKSAQSERQNYEQFESDSPKKFFNLQDVKQLDLRSIWLTNTDQVIRKFQQKYQEFKNEQEAIAVSLKIFGEFEKKYRINSLRQITVNFDKKAIYKEFMKNNRKAFEKLHPSLLMNICSYANDNVFLAMAKLRRVSKIFNYLFKNNQIREYLATKDLGIGYQGRLMKQAKTIPLFLGMASLEPFCKRYTAFLATVKYYKQIFYTEDIPQNSFMLDLEKAVEFINQVHKIVYVKRSRDLHYFSMVNKTMKKNRLVIGLSALSLTSLVLIRKISIIAFSNYLAFNVSQRKKQEITKTKYQKVIEVVSDQFYKYSLIVNTKVSNFLHQKYNKDIAIFIAHYDQQNAQHFLQNQCRQWDFLIFHIHDESKSFFFQDITMKWQRVRQFGRLSEGQQIVDRIQQIDQQEEQEEQRVVQNQQGQWLFSRQRDVNRRMDFGNVQVELLSRDMREMRISIMKNGGQELQILELKNGSQQITLQNQDIFSYCYLYTTGQYYVMLFGRTQQY